MALYETLQKATSEEDGKATYIYVWGALRDGGAERGQSPASSS